MRTAFGLALLGLLPVLTAAAADTQACAVRKGLYDEWLTLNKRGTGLRRVQQLVGASSTSGSPNTDRSIALEYQSFFQCLSEKAAGEGKAPEDLCVEAANDRLAALVCQTVAYVKDGRSAGKEFLDAIPTGRRGAEMIWDLDMLASLGGARPPAFFLPRGPAYKLIDEIFVLVLDDKEAAVNRFFNIASGAVGPSSAYLDQQTRVMLLEAPAVVVSQWAVVRQSLPRLRKILAEMAASLPAADMRRLRQGIAGFCTKDNLDCPEILKTFGRPE